MMIKLTFSVQKIVHLLTTQLQQLGLVSPKEYKPQIGIVEETFLLIGAIDSSLLEFNA